MTMSFTCNVRRAHSCTGVLERAGEKAKLRGVVIAEGEVGNRSLCWRFSPFAFHDVNLLGQVNRIRSTFQLRTDVRPECVSCVWVCSCALVSRLSRSSLWGCILGL